MSKNAFVWLVFLTAAVLLIINLAGLFLPLRAADVDQYVDFAGTKTTPYKEAQEELDRLAKVRTQDSAFLEDVTRVFHRGVAHIRPKDVQEFGYEHYGMRVPVFENWILFGLRYLKPDTYLDYEFCQYEKVLARGTGRCGQQALALVDYLNEIDIPTGFISLGGHAVVTAMVSPDQWHILDPDYGGVLPFDLQTAEERPEDILQYYWSSAATTNRIDHRYASKFDNAIRFGGPEIKYPRACRIETVAYFLKWAVPLALLAVAWVLRSRSKRNFQTAV